MFMEWVERVCICLLYWGVCENFFFRWRGGCGFAGFSSRMKRWSEYVLSLSVVFLVKGGRESRELWVVGYVFFFFFKMRGMVMGTGYKWWACWPEWAGQFAKPGEIGSEWGGVKGMVYC